jgi:predicted alpha/beta superfamily hydrolase
MAQSAIRVSRELGISTPSIIGVWHSSTKENPWGRGKDLVPEKYFREDIEVHNDYAKVLEDKSMLQSDSYFKEIFESIVPALEPEIDSKNTAMIGSSMGALATLYAVAQMPERFSTALALSPHWPFGGNPLVEKTINSLPLPGTHKVWMSHGTKGLDSDYAPFQMYADKLMSEHGYHAHNYISRVYPRTGHNERSWAKYLDQPLNFWLDSRTHTP